LKAIADSAARPVAPFERCLPGSECRPSDTKVAGIVVGMQHPHTTFLEIVRTPKKAADD